MKKIFIDGGARIGESIEHLLIKREDLLGCDVHFFECNSDHYNTLVEIKNNNKNYNFTIHTEALWVANCDIDFYISIDRWGDLGCTLHPEKKEKLDLGNPRKIKAIDIVEFIDLLDEESYIVLKLDVEGSEYEILNRLILSERINKINELFVEFHDGFFGKNSSEIKNKLKNYNIKIDDNWM